MPAFKCLYFLDNFYLSIIEIKRLDVELDEAEPDLYLWLRLDKDTGHISQLDFRSMDSAAEIQERYFEQGFLKFSPQIGTYIEKFNSAQHPLTNMDPTKLEQAAQAAIEGYLLAMAQPV